MSSLDSPSRAFDRTCSTRRVKRRSTPLTGATMMSRGSIVFCLLLFSSGVARGDGPGDNNPDNVKRIPALGIEVPADVRQELEQGLRALKTEIDGLSKKIDELSAKKDEPSRKLAAKTRELLPDVQIYFRAVHD